MTRERLDGERAVNTGSASGGGRRLRSMLLPIALGVALVAVLAVAIVQTVRARNAAASHRAAADEAAAALAAQSRSSAD